MTQFATGAPFYSAFEENGVWRLWETTWFINRYLEEEDRTILRPETYPTKEAAESAAKELRHDAVRRSRLPRDRGRSDGG